MKISAKIIADSVSHSKEGHRITTLQLCYPRFIHSELMTHRVFSRNAMSSRAVPVAKMIEQVRNDPVIPLHWGKNQPGMQAREELSGEDRVRAIVIWREAAREAADCAERMSALGAHKQVVNRLLEPFQWMHTILTSTEWDNFFELRCHTDAEPHMERLARAMLEAIESSEPEMLFPGQWHLPYVDWCWGAASPGRVVPQQVFKHKVDQDSWHPIDLQKAIKCSVARSARVSFLNHDQSLPNIEKDVDLHDKLVVSRPIHASPAEHQATPDDEYQDFKEYYGNFRGWIQWRKVLEANTGEYFLHHHK